MLKKVRDKLSLLGPSILWASAAIGVSHIVPSMSTKILIVLIYL